jgi:hypothetical protein
MQHYANYMGVQKLWALDEVDWLLNDFCILWIKRDVRDQRCVVIKITKIATTKHTQLLALFYLAS